MSDLPAYFLDGPHAGESMLIGSPSIFLFPVPREPLEDFFSLIRGPFDLPDIKTDDYEFVREARLYRYKGRFPR